MIIDINSTVFNEMVIDSKKPVVVDFSATWCAPCKKQTEILNKLSEEYPDLLIVKVDADDSPDLVSQFNIKSIPTLVFFNDGEDVVTRVGLTSLTDLKDKFLPQIGIK